MSWAMLLEAAEAIRAAAVARDGRVESLPIAGVGWATVDHERAERELDALLGAIGPWAPVERDPVLGARGRLRAAEGSEEQPFLVVLEPDTEGRLAASLARFGEGVAVVYLGGGGPGPGTLVRGGPAWGPHAIVLLDR
jgi:hypothetical protein